MDVINFARRGDIKALDSYQGDINRLIKVQKERVTVTTCILYEACKYNQELLVKYLLEKRKADPNVVSNNNQTPLYIAVERGALPIVKLLLDAGADQMLPNDNDETPLYKAAEKSYLAIARELLRHDSSDDIINGSNTDENTPLMIATMNNNYSIVDLLIRHNADIEQANEEGDTPLIIAAKKGYNNICALLLEAGANVVATDIVGHTAYYYVLLVYRQLKSLDTSTDVTKMLQSYGQILMLMESYNSARSAPDHGTSRKKLTTIPDLTTDIDKLYLLYDKVRENDPDCGERRLKQISGTCWFNSVVNVMILSSAIRTQMQVWLRRYFDGQDIYADVEDMLKRNVCSKNVDDILKVILFCTDSIMKTDFDFVKDLGKIVRLDTLQKEGASEIEIADHFLSVEWYPDSLLTLIFEVLEEALKVKVFIGGLRTFKKLQTPHDYDMVFILADYSQRFSLFEHQTMGNYYLDSAILYKTSQHVFSAYTCNDNLYIYDSHKDSSFQIDWIRWMGRQTSELYCNIAVYMPTRPPA